MSKIANLFLVLDIVILNILVGFLIVKSQTGKSVVEATNNSSITTQYIDKCGTDCQIAIAAEILKIPTPMAIVFPTALPTQKVSLSEQPKSKKVRKEEILTIPGNGSTTSNDWGDIGGTSFYFDTRDYPGIVEVYFEAKISLQNGNGLAYVRLYDGTNNIAVNGSENSTTSQVTEWTKSQKVYFWAGRNLIRVQAKSLTADTAVYEQGRMKIIVEN